MCSLAVSSGLDSTTDCLLSNLTAEVLLAKSDDECTVAGLNDTEMRK